MKVLILGSKGNLGSQLVKIFSNGNVVIGWDRDDIDITNKQELTQKVLDLKPEIIINAVAYNAVDKCEEDRSQYALAKKLNAQAAGDLADLAIELDCILAHYSTDYVFEGNNEKGYNEEAQQHPINKYGETKFMGEQEILKRKDKGLKYYLIRTSKLFGPKGESQMAKPSFFDIIKAASLKEKIIKLVDYEVSCFTYTTDLALATQNIVKNNLNYGIYHITNSGACSWYKAGKELLNIINSKTKCIPIKASDFPRPAKRPPYSVLLNTKLNAMRSWEEALREYLGK